jgi:hypothetical protein
MWLAYIVLVRVLTRSSLDHVTVGDGLVVADVRRRGMRWLPQWGYPEWDRTVVGWYALPCEPMIAREANCDKWSLWPSAARFFSRGCLPAHDCVTVAIAAMHCSGIPCPPRLASVAALDRWLRSQGYDYTPVSPSR